MRSWPDLGREATLSQTRPTADLTARSTKRNPNGQRKKKELLAAGADLFRLYASANTKDYPFAEMAKAWKVSEASVPEKVSEMAMIEFRSSFHVTAEQIVQCGRPDFNELAQREAREDIEALQKCSVTIPLFSTWLIARFQSGKIVREVDLDFTRRLLKGHRADMEAKSASKEEKLPAKEGR